MEAWSKIGPSFLVAQWEHGDGRPRVINHFDHFGGVGWWGLGSVGIGMEVVAVEEVVDVDLLSVHLYFRRYLQETVCDIRGCEFGLEERLLQLLR